MHGVVGHAVEAHVGIAFDSVEAMLGPVDILIKNGAHFENADTVFHVSGGAFDRYSAVNSGAPALLMGEFARRWAGAVGGHTKRACSRQAIAS